LKYDENIEKIGKEIRRRIAKSCHIGKRAVTNDDLCVLLDPYGWIIICVLLCVRTWIENIICFQLNDKNCVKMVKNMGYVITKYVVPE
jgi:hypothetical protein